MCLGVGRHISKDRRGLGSCLPVGARAASPPQVPGSKPLRQDRTVSDPWHPFPLPNICCSSQGWLTLSSSCCPPQQPPSYFSWRSLHCDLGTAWGMLLWPFYINKSCTCSHDPWGQIPNPFSGSWFSIWKHRSSWCVPKLLDFIEELWDWVEYNLVQLCLWWGQLNNTKCSYNSSVVFKTPAQTKASGYFLKGKHIQNISRWSLWKSEQAKTTWHARLYTLHYLHTGGDSFLK